MTSPTDVPAAPPAPAAEETPPLSLRRVLRTEGAETWDLLGGEDRVGVVSLQYSAESVEGVLLLPAGVDADSVRGILAWVTELLQLDTAAGSGGTIHWVTSVGEIEEFWRRSPGRKPTGAESDVATTRARVEQVLGQMFKEVATLPDDGGYAVDAGSVRVFVTVRLNGANVLVRVFAITNLDVAVDTDLPAYLLSLNFTMALGRFSLDTAKRDVWFDHVLGADDLDDGALARTIAAVASTADHYDDEIKAKYGGRTFREEGSPVSAAGAGSGMAGGYL